MLLNAVHLISLSSLSNENGDLVKMEIYCIWADET